MKSLVGHSSGSVMKKAYRSPPLTTVNIPRTEIGHIAFDALVLKGGETWARGREFRINSELVSRETSGAAPGAY